MPSTLAISIAEDGVDVSPLTLGRFGERQQNVSQNRTATPSQSDNQKPLAVRGAIANLTRAPTRLVIQGPVDKTVPVTRNGSTGFTAALPTGVYRLSSPATPKTTLLTVGRARYSSATDVLTP